MFSAPQLLDRFKARRAYQRAAPWQKPWLDPARFLRNQFRKRGLIPRRTGELRTTATFHLPKFVVVNGEGVSEQIASYGIYEENLTEAFLRLIKPEQVVVDIGMHIGYYTTLFAILVGEKGEVHAFEPTPSTRETAALNVGQFSQVTVHPEAVWSTATSLSFHDYGRRWMAFNSFTAARMEGEDLQPTPFQVQTTTLDSFRALLRRPIAFLKIDAESAERDILLGGEKLLRSDRPLISLEVGDFQNQPTSRGLIDLLQQRDYEVWEFELGRFERHEPKANYSYDNLIFAPAGRDLSAF